MREHTSPLRWVHAL